MGVNDLAFDGDDNPGNYRHSDEMAHVWKEINTNSMEGESPILPKQLYLMKRN